MRVSLLSHIFLRYQSKVQNLHKDIYTAVESYYKQFYHEYRGNGIFSFPKTNGEPIEKCKTIFNLAMHPNLSFKIYPVYESLKTAILESVDTGKEIRWSEAAPSVFNVKDMATMSGHIKSLRTLKAANIRLYEKCFDEDLKWQDISDITQYGVGNSFILMVRYYWLWRKEKETLVLDSLPDSLPKDKRPNPLFTNFLGMLPITSPVANSMQELLGTGMSSTLRASAQIHMLTSELKQFEPTIDAHDVNSILWLMSYK
jgi:hypothetical protein